jgi:hypothetical protein
MLCCVAGLLLGSCDTRRTDAPAETIITGDTRGGADTMAVPLPPPPPTGTVPPSDRGAGTEPGTGVVETGAYRGAPETEDTIRTSTIDPAPTR